MPTEQKLRTVNYASCVLNYGVKMNKKLYRSVESRMIAGVCGGLGEYFEIDPTLVRLITVALLLAGGGGLLAYIIAWIIVPNAPVNS